MSAVSRHIRPTFFFGRRATQEARTLVLSLITEKKALTHHELFKLTEEHHRQAAQGQDPTVADTDAIIPSMRYLKQVVLPDLQLQGMVEKVHSKENISEEEALRRREQMVKAKRGKVSSMATVLETWKWQLKTPEPEPLAQETDQPFGVEVGVGEDWSHLNKRRQRSRLEKIARDVDWMKTLDRAQKEGSTQTSAAESPLS